MNLKGKSVLVYDYGLFPEIAARLARDFGTVYYYVSWEEAFPKMNRALIGNDFKGIVRVRDFEDYIEKVDMIVFPDTHSASKAEFLIREGYNIAAVGYGEEVELDRAKTRELQKFVGLPTQDTVVAHGITELKDMLGEMKNKYVKLNIFRGDVESFHHLDYESSLPIINHLQYDLGPKGESVDFVIEDFVKGAEPGLDGIYFEGEYLTPTMFGYEVKGSGYIAKVIPYDKLPIQIKQVSEGMKEMLPRNYRFFFSHEERVMDRKDGYLIDPCCRFAAPAVSAVQTELIENFSEVVWGLATGEKIEPIMKYKYAGGIVLYSDWACNNWLNVQVDKNIDQWVKFRWVACFDGEYWVAPGSSTVCTVVALGNSVQEVFDLCVERAEKVKAYQISGGKEELNKVLDAIKEGEKYGIQF